MPRRDWNTPSAHTQKPHHARMRSAAKGRGHDKKHRAAKRGITYHRHTRKNHDET